MKGVFDTRPESGYDDDIARRYHFPRQYRSVADSLVGSWIIYCEPQRKGGRRAYVQQTRSALEYDLSHFGQTFA
jgi:putative restriction endonuclease